MKFTVLGSGAAGGNAASGCTSFLAQSGPTHVLIDCGSGAIPELKRWIDVRKLDAIVISHMHLDHILDLVTLRAAYRYAPEPFDARVPLWLPPGGQDILDGLAAPLDLDHHAPLFFDQVYETQEYNPIDSLQIGEIAINFAATQHPIPAWAMRIARAGSRSFAGIHLGHRPHNEPGNVFPGMKTLVCEATLLQSDISPMDRNHLTAAEAGRLADTCHARRLVLTHFWEELGAERLAGGCRPDLRRTGRARVAGNGAIDLVSEAASYSIGHWTDRDAITGCTVILFDRLVPTAFEARGGAPGTRETDLLRSAHRCGRSMRFSFPEEARPD